MNGTSNILYFEFERNDDRIKYMIENTKNNLNHFVNFLCP